MISLYLECFCLCKSRRKSGFLNIKTSRMMLILVFLTFIVMEYLESFHISPSEHFTYHKNLHSLQYRTGDVLISHGQTEI